jgi:hypothetical protein
MELSQGTRRGPAAVAGGLKKQARRSAQYLLLGSHDLVVPRAGIEPATP